MSNNHADFEGCSLTSGLNRSDDALNNLTQAAQRLVLHGTNHLLPHYPKDNLEGFSVYLSNR